MRNLTRFRSNFQSKHSLRSKFLETKLISDDINELIVTNRTILQQEQAVLDSFGSQKQSLLLRQMST
jgi:hypothetical protein